MTFIETIVTVFGCLIVYDYFRTFRILRDVDATLERQELRIDTVIVSVEQNIKDIKETLKPLVGEMK